MRTTHLMLVAATTFAATFLSSCSMDPYVISAEEEYTRNFIKSFGLIDPDQDWNLAQQGTVTVKLAGKAKSVKTYMLVDGTYYLVADLTDVDGTLSIPFDMPEGTTDLMVNVDGKKYYTTTGATLDTSSAPASRSLALDDDGNEISSTTLTDADGNEYTVKVSNADWLYFNAQQVAPITANMRWADYHSIRGSGDNPSLTYIYRTNPDKNYIRDLTSGDVYYSEYIAGSMKGWGLLPELNDKSGDAITGNTSIKNPDGTPAIVEDFYIVPGDDNKIVVYPIYKNTNQNHTLGIYLIGDDGKPVKGADGEILKFPFYSINNYNLSTSGFQYLKLSESSSGGSSSGGDSSDEDPSETQQVWYYLSGWSGFPSGFQTYLSGIGKSDLNKSGNGSYSSTDDLYEVMGLFKDWFNNDQPDITDFSVYKADDADGTVSNWTSTSFPSSTSYKIDTISTSQPTNWSIYWTFTISKRTDTTVSYALGRSDDDEVPQALKIKNGTWSTLEYQATDYFKDSYNAETNPDGHNYSKEGSALYPVHEPLLLRTQGITVDLGDWDGNIGMYITNNDPKYLHSQKELNTTYTLSDGSHRSYAASYTHPMSDRTYFSFEDWAGVANGDKDLNDLIFLLNDFAAVTDGTNEITGDTPGAPKTDETINEDGYTWLLAVEDLGATDDFDFNDVVMSISAITVTADKVDTDNVRFVGSKDGFDITKTVTTTSADGSETSTTTEKVKAYRKVTFTALAAGGTLNTYVFYGDELLYPDDADESQAEWHKWFGNGNIASTSMINTGTGSTATGKSCTIYFGSGFTLTNYADKAQDVNGTGTFKIGIDTSSNTSSSAISKDYFEQDENGYFIKPGNAGAAPQMFLIPDEGNESGTTGWQWPTERSHILGCYPDFQDWVTNAKDNKWYRNPKSGVYPRK